ncbi:MAG: hypothetical protein U0J93_08040, partial [Parolsenella sp.]|uniref:hypothetical protein n=1 Tax=Parolsenella sp. TaxID=2083006 RepID=UPI002E79FFA5
DKDYARGAHYPGRDAVEHAIKLAQGLLARGQDPADLLPAIKDAYDGLLDAAEDLEPVEEFWRGQRNLFDRAYGLAKRLADETGYLEANQDATDALKQLREIVDMDTPYKRIKDLGDYCHTLESAYEELLKTKRSELLDAVNDFYNNIEGYAQERGVASPSEVSTRKLDRQNTVHTSASLTKLDALRTQLENDQRFFYSEIDKTATRKQQETNDAKKGSSSPSPTPSIPTQPQDAAPAKPRVKKVPRFKACPPKQLRSAKEINAYCADLKQYLLQALEDADVVQIN